MAVLVAAAIVGLGIAAASSTAGVRNGAAKPSVSIDSVRVGSKAAPVAFMVRTNRDAEVTVRVNGRGADGQFEYFGAGARIVHLSASDGLKGGANSIRVIARVDGRRATAERGVNVPAGLLVADAGENVEMPVGTGVRLGAAPSGAGARPGLRHRWRIVDAPKGANAKLGSADSARPVLRSKTPGSYVLRQTSQVKGGGERAHDTVTVAVVPDDKPIGVPINTLGPEGGIVINGESFGAGWDIAYAVIERSSREVVKSNNVQYDDAGLATLHSVAKTYGEGVNRLQYLMIVSGRFGVRIPQMAAFNALVKRLGGPPLGEDEFAALGTNQFSVIGIPGAAEGAATVRFPPQGSGISGAITGFLRKSSLVNVDGARPYEFATSDISTFRTRAADQNVPTNEMSVAEASYTASLPSGATAGLHVLAFDSLTMEKVYEAALATNGSGGSDRDRQRSVATALKQQFDRPGGPMILVQTMGKPRAAGPEWTAVVDQLARLGANRHFVYALNGTNEYAIVGRVNSGVAPAEATTAFDAGPNGIYGDPKLPPARLAGGITRGRDSKLVPSVGGTPTAASRLGGVNTELIGITNQAPTPFPRLAPGAPPDEVAKATAYICDKLGFCKEVDSCNLRDCYWKVAVASTWQTKYTTVSSLRYPSTSAPGFSAATFEAVRGQLADEIQAVLAVYNYFEALKAPYRNAALPSYVNLQTIGDQVWKSVQAAAPSDATARGFNLASYIAKVGTFAPPPASNVAAGLSGVFGLVGYLSRPSGQPILGAEVRAQASQLATELVGRTDAAVEGMTGISKLIVSDFGKLTAVRERLNQVNGPWAPPDDSSGTGEQLRLAYSRFFYSSLIPVAYPYLIRAPVNARSLRCQGRGGDQNLNMFPNVQDDAQIEATVGYDENGTPIKASFFFVRGGGGGATAPSSLTDSLFRPTNFDRAGVGIDKLTFLAPSTFKGRFYRAKQGSYFCDVGFLPFFDSG